MSTRPRPSLAESMQQVAARPGEPVVAQSPSPVAQLPATPSPLPASARADRFYAATRVGKKKVTAALDPTMFKQLKRLGVDREATTEALLIEAIEDLLRKHKVAVPE
jgi:hypothetical protein